MMALKTDKKEIKRGGIHWPTVSIIPFASASWLTKTVEIGAKNPRQISGTSYLQRGMEFLGKRRNENARKFELLLLINIIIFKYEWENQQGENENRLIRSVAGRSLGTAGQLTTAITGISFNPFPIGKRHEKEAKE